MKRIGIPRAKPGELLAKWGREERGALPDVVLAWGDGIHKSDAHLLHIHLCPMGRPDLFRELESRGYDIKSIKFTAKLKPTPKGESNN